MKSRQLPDSINLLHNKWFLDLSLLLVVNDDAQGRRFFGLQFREKLFSNQTESLDRSRLSRPPGQECQCDGCNGADEKTKCFLCLAHSHLPELK